MSKTNTAMVKPRSTRPISETDVNMSSGGRVTTVKAQPVAKRKTTKTGTTTMRPDTLGSEARFELTMQEAQEVLVAGTFNNWTPQPLQKLTDSVWATHFPLKPGRYEYRFVVDGTWQEDPNSAEYTQNPFGGRNSILTVS